MRHIITTKQPMTLEQFEAEFKQLLRECEDAGLDVEEFCELAEAILEQGPTTPGILPTQGGEHQMTIVTISDWGEARYLDGAEMQYAIEIGNQIIAFCDDLEIARKIAYALGDEVHIVKS